MPGTADVHWELERLPNNAGWKGTIRIAIEGPLSGRNVIAATATAKRKADTLLKAGNVVDQVVANPVVSALLPPGSRLALDVTKQIASAVQSGAAGDVIRRIGGAAGQRLAAALAEF